MGNCTGKPKVTETNLAPEPAKEEVKVEGETTETVEQVSKDVEVGEATTKVADEEKKEDVIAPEGDAAEDKTRSLGVLFNEVKETTDDKTEATETVVAEPAKEEVKAETAAIGESSTADAVEEVAKEPTVEPVKEEVKTEEPAVVVVPTVPDVETVKTEVKAETVPVEAPKIEAVVEQPAAVETDKPVQVSPVSSTEKAADAEPSK